MKALIYISTFTFYLLLIIGAQGLSAQTQPTSFYKHFSGTLAGKQIHLNLHKADADLSGSYYYEDHEELITLETPFGEQKPDEFILEESTFNEDTVNQWNFTLSKTSLKGIWQNAAKTVSHSVALKEIYPPGVTPFNYYSFHHRIDQPRPAKHTFAHRVNCSFPMPKDPSELSWLIDQIETNLRFDSALTLQENFDYMVSELEEIFKTSFEDYEEELEHYSLPDWETSISLEITYNHNGYVVIEKKETHQMGGAHGYTENTFYAYDIEHKKPMDLSSITSISKPHLQTLLEEQFRNDHDLGENELLDQLLFKNEIPLTTNFGFHNRGIYFIYKPYEIGPYSMGSIRILIPYSQLGHTLDSTFKQRMGLKPEI